MGQNVSLPAGSLEAGDVQRTLRLRGRVARPEQIGALVLRDQDGRPVRVSDVARVEDGQEEGETLAVRNGERGVLLSVRKQADANTVAVVDAVESVWCDPGYGQGLTVDGNRATDRLPGTVRNQFTTPSIYQFDARLTRSIRFTENMRVRLILEAFNVFNRANVATVNNTFFNYSGGTSGTLTSPNPLVAFGTPRTFGSPASGTTTFATPRQVQLAIKFDF